jgi:hypothetical protein
LIRRYIDKIDEIEVNPHCSDLLYLKYFDFIFYASFQLSIPALPVIQTHQKMQDFFDNETSIIIKPIGRLNPKELELEDDASSENVYNKNAVLHSLSVNDYLEERNTSVVNIYPVLQRMIRALYSHLLHHLNTSVASGSKHPGIEFIENNLDELICVGWPDIQKRDKNSVETKIAQVLNIFSDCEDIYQIAVRAINPYSVSGFDSEGEPHPFSSKKCERMLALVYLEIEASSAEDKPNLMYGLIYALAEIQRANSLDPHLESYGEYDNTEDDLCGSEEALPVVDSKPLTKDPAAKEHMVFHDDEPACIEGAMIRIARILSSHPQYSDLYSQDRESLIIEAVSTFVAKKFKEELSDCSTCDEKALLYESLIMMDPFNPQFCSQLNAHEAFGPLAIVITDNHVARRQAFINKYFNDDGLIKYINGKLTDSGQLTLKSGEYLNPITSLLFQTGEPKLLGPALARVYAEYTAQDALKPTVKNPYITRRNTFITPLYQQKLAFKAMLFDKVYAEKKGAPEKLKRVIDEVVALIYQEGKPPLKNQARIISVIKSIYTYMLRKMAITDKQFEKVCKTALALPEPSIEQLMSKLSSSVHSEEPRRAAAPLL